MDKHVQWMLVAKVRDGELDTFKKLMAGMIKTTQDNEPGALNYEWHIGDDGKTCHIYERYADDAATMTHLASFGQNFAKDFMSVASIEGITMYGNPGDEVREAMKAMGPVYMSPIGGFARY